MNTSSAISIGKLRRHSRLLFANYPHSEEQKPLEEFFQAKGLKAKNEMLDDVSALLSEPNEVLAKHA